MEPLLQLLIEREKTYGYSEIYFCVVNKRYLYIKYWWQYLLKITRYFTYCDRKVKDKEKKKTFWDWTKEKNKKNVNTSTTREIESQNNKWTTKGAMALLTNAWISKTEEIKASNKNTPTNCISVM